MKSKFAKIGALTVGMTFALSLSVNTAGAQSVAELQAQINALMAQLAALSGGSAPAASVTFTQDMTIGSTGSQVVALQQMLVAQGHLVMPAGVAYGYFGPLTRAAVAKWQAANGVAPAVGYFGPISRAKANSMGGGTVPGTTIPGGTTGGSITTPGVEGTLAVTLNSTPTGVKLYEGDSRREVMGIKVEAKQSDIRIERVKLNLGSNTNIYRRIADRIYIMDGSTVLASADLNSNTVVREGNNYFITLSGVNVVVSKDSTRVLTVALDAMSTWDQQYDGDSWTLQLADDGVRGVDGAGINQFSPTTGSTVSRSFTSEGDITENASLKVSLNTNSPASRQVVGTAGVDEDEVDMLELLRFDVRAEKDAIEIIDLTATTTGDAVLSTVYLMDGSTVIGSEAPGVGGAVTFSDIDYVVSRDSTRTLTIKADVRDLTANASTTAVSVVASGFVAENSFGDVVSSVSGSATGEPMTLLNVGPEVTLTSKTMTGERISFSGGTATGKATFNLQLRAVGGDLYFGPQASSTFEFDLLRGGTVVIDNDDGDSVITGATSSVSWIVPSSGVITSGIASGGFILQEGNTTNVTVEYLLTGNSLLTSGAYSVGLAEINWGTSTTINKATNFFDGKSDWRTNSVTLP